jgi:hypothetical protein
VKDINHHQAKFQKKILRHTNQEEIAMPRTMEDSKEEVRKKTKEMIKETREEHIPVHKSEFERNKEHKCNGPVRKGNTGIH